MIPTDVAPQGSDLGGAFVIFAALVAVAGVVWLAGWIRGERQRRRGLYITDDEYSNNLALSLTMAYAEENQDNIYWYTERLEDLGFTVTYDTETLSLRVEGPAS